ncbi:MAG TPA: PAS domain-containing sensor histidine kinase [Pseudohongiella sp.]|nr:PAS domain-containing sensor histidine kinase [Gammaproteobacteria bacterium]HBN13534.1 PAS domain-containing sensor histidine kinase [Pseudohongiella sp.]|tara:strand:- start:1375 stop:2652 length:1278 start_codon:yes stop_codon:yes gene_type:complete
MAASSLTLVRDIQSQPNSAQALELAFKAFNELSGELTQTYQALESQVRDLTAELEAANAQRLRELAEKERIAHRLTKLLQLLPGGVLVLNARGQISECNAAALDLLGSPLEGELWVEIIRTRFAPRSDDGHEISLVNGKRVSLLSRSLEEEPGQIILITDQTETRRLQQRLSRHQRLTEMGQMVSSLAHQIRTPLAAAMLYAGHLAHALPSQAAQAGDDQPADADRLQRTHDRLMSRLHNMERQVRDMLVFARGEAVLDARLSMAQLFDETRVAAEVLLRDSRTRCQWTNEAPDCLLDCNQESLVGAILNLLENAQQNGGAQVQLKVIADHNCEAGHLRFFVQDNGPGIDPKVLSQVTEAFYTTRAQGTGLGLAVAQVVARAHGGRFFIENLASGNLHPEAEKVSGIRAGFVLPCQGKATQEQTV